MQLDVIDLKDFYARPLGLMVRRLLRARIRARWRDLKAMRAFGIGYATPYLGEFRGEAGALGALMPAGLGALPWPERGQSMTALVDETELPLDDEAADRILLVHMLEWSERSRVLLREIWRVLSPNGRLLLIVPNRRGLWARVDTTPFGYGSPFSRSQLAKLLKEAMFSPEAWHYALYMPPFNWRILIRWPAFWERLGLILWPTFSGVIMVEATKQVYAAMPVRESAQKARRQIVPVPAGAVTPRSSARPFIPHEY
ncbi:MAG: methyltransferase domain-containing protein [Methyloceanibacter sp.]|uniref:methyltransferase domain-containing protein n=1 Tax=Methyloceanibacter sp. TaxID=1965321 RepID=UPI003D6CD7CF